MGVRLFLGGWAIAWRGYLEQQTCVVELVRIRRPRPRENRVQVWIGEGIERRLLLDRVLT